MPKEHIENRWFGRPVKYVDGSPDGPADNSYVAIGWSKGHGDVQIGLVRPTLGSQDDEQIWLDLDRDGCNAAIRLLRKARDQANGVDA